MHPFHVFLISLLGATSLAAPSPPTYEESFPKPKETIEDPYGKSSLPLKFLDLPALQASNDSVYHLSPQTPGTCVVICVMAPHPDWKLRYGNSAYDNYLQYACAPSCNEDIGDHGQPIKGDLEFPTIGDGEKLTLKDFPENAVVVTFDDIARPGEEGNKDGFSRANRFIISCSADQRGLDAKRETDISPLQNFACQSRTGLDPLWAALVPDPYSVGRFNPIWWKTGGTAESTGVCKWATSRG